MPDKIVSVETHDIAVSEELHNLYKLLERRLLVLENSLIDIHFTMNKILNQMNNQSNGHSNGHSNGQTKVAQ